MTPDTAQPGQLAIIGGGTMGADIAAVFLAGGWQVHVMSPSASTREGLPDRVARALAKLDAPPQATLQLGVHATVDALPWHQMTLVLESVTEDLALKQRLFQQVEPRVSPDTILASNTSNFAIGSLAQVLQRPQRLLGLHFFMPAHLVPLVEVISSVHTDPALAEWAVALMKGLGKMPIWVKKDIPGFVGNRLQHAMMREALYLMEDGVVTAEEVDVAVRYGFGFRFMACGPMLQKEMSGWDTNQLVASALYPHLHNEAAYPPGMNQMVQRGHIGMKTKRGLWQWTEDSAREAKANIERTLQAALALLKAAP